MVKQLLVQESKMGVLTTNIVLKCMSIHKGKAATPDRVSHLVTTPVLTFTTSRCPVALPTANLDEMVINSEIFVLPKVGSLPSS